jgi:CheY-like chemotaxis protein
MDSLGQLAGGMAHDFNNLLAVLLSYATFVSRSLGAASGSGAGMNWDEARADMEHIEKAVDWTAGLTRQLLAFASREAIRPLALDLNEVIGGMEELPRRVIGGHIQLATSLAGGLWPVLATRGKIEQVLVDLAVNARHAMPGATLTIATDNITTAGGDPEAHQEHRVLPRVTHTGTGMTPRRHRARTRAVLHHQGRQQGHRARPRHGLGDTHPRPGPASGSPPRPGPGPPSRSPARHGRDRRPAAESAPSDWEPHGDTVLVVEDEDDLREVTRRIFADAGYYVIAAASGPEALETARSRGGPIHLLITDIVMPHMLGTEVAEIMREIRPGAGVLYMSGYAWPVFASRGGSTPKRS